jgi:hypothetical protein
VITTPGFDAMMGFDLPFPPSKWMKNGEMQKIQFQ